MHRAIDRLGSLQVRDVMTRKVISVSANQTLAEVAQIFAEKDISSAPVVDPGGACVGVLSSVDFFKGRHGVSGAGDSSDASLQRRVAECMSPQVASIGADELLLKAAQVMCARHVHRLPVVGEGKRIEGLISTMDIISAMLNAIDEAEAVQFGKGR
jgi:predicted transcriptional regulator